MTGFVFAVVRLRVRAAALRGHGQVDSRTLLAGDTLFTDSTLRSSWPRLTVISAAAGAEEES